MLETGTGEDAVGLPELLGVGRGEGSEGKFELNSVAMYPFWKSSATLNGVGRLFAHVVSGGLGATVAGLTAGGAVMKVLCTGALQPRTPSAGGCSAGLLKQVPLVAG